MRKSGVPLIKIMLYGLLLMLLTVCVAAGVLFTTSSYADEDEPVTKITLEGGNVDIQILMNTTVPYSGAANNIPADKITVRYNGETLTYETDYTLTSEDVNVGKAGVTVTGIGAYEGTVIQPNLYDIVKVTLSEDNLSYSIPDGNGTVHYTGSANNLPEGVVIKLNGVALQEFDYELTSTSVEEGAADITVTAKGGNCEGTVTFTGAYNIEKITLTSANLTCTVAEDSKNVGYTGSVNNIPENVTVTYNDGENEVTLTSDDYELTSDSISAGAASLTVVGKGAYKGEVTFENAYNIVKQESNEWVEEPNILSWTYGQFSVKTSGIAARPKSGFAMLFIIKATDDFQGTVGEGVTINGKYFFTFEEDYTLSGEVIDALNNLPVGKYFLRAMLPATSDYNGLPQVDVRFEVAPLTNYWESSPNIIWWSYGQFQSNVNRITAKPRYILDGHLVTFTVYDKDYLNPVNKALTGFTTDNGTNVFGIVTNTDVIGALNALDAGTYYLEASYHGDSNMPALRTPIMFNVFQINNHWEVTPNVVQWRWGEYDSAVNTVYAVPSAGEVEDVVYGIYTDKLCNDRVSETLKAFSYIKKSVPVTDQNGHFVRYEVTYSLPERVIDALANLDAGTYYMRASLAATNNYTGLGAASSIEFNVQNVQNNWTTTPSVLSWKYGEYDKTFNKITAQPALGEQTVFGIYDRDGEAVLFSDGDKIVSSFTLADGLVPEYVAQKLKTLGVGKYYMLASVEGTVNYTGLNNYKAAEDIKEHAIEFEVTTATNIWTDIPKILSWGEGHFDKETNAVIATAANGNDKMLICVYDGSGNLVATNDGSGELNYDELAKLGVGSYRVTFKIDGTNNYSELTGETTFAVFEDSVGLSGIIAAAIIFGVFDVAAAGICIALIIRRRKKIEENFREMVRRELGRR